MLAREASVHLRFFTTPAAGCSLNLWQNFMGMHDRMTVDTRFLIVSRPFFDGEVALQRFNNASGVVVNEVERLIDQSRLPKLAWVCCLASIVMWVAKTCALFFFARRVVSRLEAKRVVLKKRD